MGQFSALVDSTIQMPDSDCITTPALIMLVNKMTVRYDFERINKTRTKHSEDIAQSTFLPDSSLIILLLVL